MKHLLLPALLLTAAAALAQGPNSSGTYYRNADGKSGAALKTALFSIISKKNSLSYDALPEAYKTTDTRPDGYLRDWYSNTTKYTPGSRTTSYSKEGDTYNREHSIPQSWGAPKADIMHVIPTDGYVNNRRGNLPFGEVGTVKYQSNNGYSKVGTSKTAGYSGQVFEPNDEVKGDIARIYFYMATCYESTITSWSSDALGGTKYQPFAQWTFDMLMRWSQQDPVDSIECARNNAIARSDIQGNRNPFVDYPGLEQYVWGSKVGTAFSYDKYEDTEQGPVIACEQPVFSPEGGTFTDRVTVEIATATSGATIYYTTNGAEPSEQSRLYTAPITITETTVLKAIAVKDGLANSYQAVATYVIEKSQGTDTPAEGTFALNDALFGTAFCGSLGKADFGDFSATTDGITITYSIGTGSNQYINGSQLRLYPGNTLTVSCSKGELKEVEFTVVQNKNNKVMEADSGSVTDYIWSGSATAVVFSVNSGSGHIQLSQAKVKATTPTGIDTAVEATNAPTVIYDLQGRRILQPRHGLYIVNGRKVVMP